MRPEVLIVAGEASGDLHGAHLIRSLKRLSPGLDFTGIGGEEIKKTGAEILFDASKISVVGFFEVISHLSEIIAAQRTVRKKLSGSKPALLILIDFPDFNLLLARKAKKLGIPVFYYISPQVWAWRSGRVKTIRRLVDKIGVILPFEQEYYRQRGVDATYVGHPLLDSVVKTTDRNEFCIEHKILPGNRLIGILPGSRIKEVSRLLPVFLEAAHQLQESAVDQCTFLVPRATTLSEEVLLDNGITDYQDRIDIRIISEDRYNMMAACDIVIAASGTVTLELLLLNTPMVVAYKLSPYTYRLGKLLVKVKYFSLVNLIGDEMIVPELLQDEANPIRISEELHRVLYDTGSRHLIEKGFIKVRKRLGNPGASDQAAKLALSLIQHLQN